MQLNIAATCNDYIIASWHLCQKSIRRLGCYSAPPDPVVGFKGLLCGREGRGREGREERGGITFWEPLSLCKVPLWLISISGILIGTFFTPQCYASVVCAMGLCLSVCLSVTSRCSTKMARRRITSAVPHNSPGTLVFWCQRYPRNSTGFNHYGGATWLAIARKQYKIDAQFLLKSNRKLYVLHRMWHCWWPWVTPNCPKLPQFLYFAPFFISYLHNGCS